MSDVFGVYLYEEAQFRHVDPSTHENAERELVLVGEPGEVVTETTGMKMQNAANHVRRVAWNEGYHQAELDNAPGMASLDAWRPNPYGATTS